mmetsp:Transcript_123042/g.353501  ORF Transcript_123042/g.353501 Transcript_123042/m.353501 type:complete len:299 (+) Transcript_123042:491-1387(+)
MQPLAAPFSVYMAWHCARAVLSLSDILSTSTSSSARGVLEGRSGRMTLWKQSWPTFGSFCWHLAKTASVSWPRVPPCTWPSIHAATMEPNAVSCASASPRRAAGIAARNSAFICSKQTRLAPEEKSPLQPATTPRSASVILLPCATSALALHSAWSAQLLFSWSVFRTNAKHASGVSPGNTAAHLSNSALASPAKLLMSSWERSSKQCELHVSHLHFSCISPCTFLYAGVASKMSVHVGLTSVMERWAAAGNADKPVTTANFNIPGTEGDRAAARRRGRAGVDNDTKSWFRRLNSRRA